jgi:hypothetical protein
VDEDADEEPGAEGRDDDADDRRVPAELLLPPAADCCWAAERSA